MEQLISQTKSLSWKDLKLEPTVEETKKTLELALVGSLVAAHPLNKFAIHACIKATWNFIQEFLIKDLKPTSSFFTFQTPLDKQRILKSSPLEFQKSFVNTKTYATRSHSTGDPTEPSSLLHLDSWITS